MRTSDRHLIATPLRGNGSVLHSDWRNPRVGTNAAATTTHLSPRVIDVILIVLDKRYLLCLSSWCLFMLPGPFCRLNVADFD
jgi:hypothetical protein